MNSDDWRFSDERMQLRGAVFRALKHHLDEHCRAVYEFCNMWVSQGNKNTDNIESHFQTYLQETHNENVYKLEKCFDIDSDWYLSER